MELTIELIIKGRVQGVGFRYYTLQIAQELNIKGYVKNLYDRSVYVIAQASETTLNLFVAKLKKGPTRANVQKIIQSKIEGSPNYASFQIR